MEDKKFAKTHGVEGAKPTEQSTVRLIFTIAVSLALLITGIGFGVTFVFTGLGALVGIPLIVAGLVAPFFLLRSFFARQKVRGRCPYCGAQIIIEEHLRETDCPSCQKHLEVREKKVFKVE